MDYEWDRTKAVTNLRKHGVDFADAATSLEDPHAITIEQEHGSELRFVTLGLDALGRLLVVVYTWRAEKARIISARSATGSERESYGRQL